MTTSIEIDADDLVEGLAQLETATALELFAAHRAVGEMVESEAKRIAPNVTGALAESIQASAWPHGTPQSGLETIVLANAPYALPVHDGARPHRIEARNARALRFTVGGQVRFARAVNHPGQRPQPFFENTLSAKAGDIHRAFEEAYERAMRRAGFR